MDFKQLEYFRHVAEFGSFTRAAASLVGGTAGVEPANSTVGTRMRPKFAGSQTAAA